MRKKRFDSIYSDSKITESQYLSEYILQHCAKQTNTVLPKRFWTIDEWKSWGKRIVPENIQASKLLKTYSFKAIKLAIDDHRAKYLKTLHNKKLLELIIEYQTKINVEEKIKNLQPKLDVVKNTNSLPPKRTGKQTKLNRLRD